MDNPLPIVRSKLPIADAIALRLENNLSWSEIATKLNVSRSSIHKACRPFLVLMKNGSALPTFRDNRVKLFEAAEMRLLRSVVDEQSIKSAPLAARATAFGILNERRRLEAGLSTSNLAVVAEIDQICAESDDIRSELDALQRQIDKLQTAKAPK